jgi:ferredoxin, 2Fe-2S
MTPADGLDTNHREICLFRHQAPFADQTMPKITFIEHDGTVHDVQAADGESIMEAAMRGSVAGIVAECGGSCTCATCHIYVDEAWLAKTGERSLEEDEQLDNAFDVRPNSRLSCQIKMSEELDGILVRTPSYQGR